MLSKSETMLDFRAENMTHEDVHFLNAGGFLARHNDERMGECPESAAIFARECGGGHSFSARDFKSSYHVGAVAGSGYSESDIAGLAEGFELPGKDLFKAEIIGASGERGGIGCEGEAGEGAAIFDEADR